MLVLWRFKTQILFFWDCIEHPSHRSMFCYNVNLSLSHPLEFIEMRCVVSIRSCLSVHKAIYNLSLMYVMYKRRPTHELLCMTRSCQVSFIIHAYCDHLRDTSHVFVFLQFFSGFSVFIKFIYLSGFKTNAIWQIYDVYFFVKAYAIARSGSCHTLFRPFPSSFVSQQYR